MAQLLALDQGTTSSRAILFNEQGESLATAQQDFEQHFPKPGWVEHDAREIWETQRQVAIDAAGKATGAINALGITNQRETTVVWDRQTGEPIAHAMVWQDRRTASMVDQLVSDGKGPLLQEKTGLVPDAYFSATKVQWLLDHVEGARTRAEAGDLLFGTIDSWLIYKLTDGRVHATDVSNASRTMLFNIHTMDWDQELLSLFNLPRSLMPEVVDSSQVIGEVSSIEELKGVPIAGIAGDQQSALFGQGCFEKGSAKNTYGTGCFMLVNTGSEPVASKNKLLTTVAWRRNESTQYALEGSVFVAGALVQWLRDGLQIIGTASEIEPLANSEPDNGGVYLVPAFAGLGAPHWDQYARGTVLGLTRGSTRGHIARAALEAIAFQVTELVEAVEKDAEFTLPELRVDGGAAANNTLMQIQSDFLQRPIVRPTLT
jgi:glycerol kinase